MNAAGRSPGRSVHRVSGLVLAVLAASLVSGCGYVAVGAVAIATSGGGSSGGGGGVPQVEPGAIVTGTSGRVGDITVSYNLQDVNDDLVTIDVFFSSDGGGSFNPVTTIVSTDDGTISGNSIVDQTASSIGDPHTFVWDTAADGLTAANTSVVVQILPTDSTSLVGLPADSQPFTVGNDAPEVEWDPLNPIPDSSGLVGVQYTLYDSTEDPSDISIEFSIDTGSTYAAVPPAEIAVGTLTTLATKSRLDGGVVHSFAWNTLQTLGVDNFPTVRLRLTAQDTWDVSAAVETNDFQVTNNDSPAIFFEPIPRQDLDIQLDFLVLDAQGDLIDVAFEFSTDGGTNWGNALLTAATSGGTPPSGNQVIGLTSSATGVATPHWVTWDSDDPTQIGTAAADSVIIRATPSDQSGTGDFRDSPVFVAGNDPPGIAIVAPVPGSNHSEGVITIEFTVTDSTSDPVDVDVRFESGSGIFQPATISVGLTQDVPSSAAGLTHKIAWNTVTDIGVANVAVTLQLTPRDDATGTIEFGIPVQTAGTFQVNNSAAPVAYIASPISSQVVRGDVVVSYLLFQENSASLDITMEYSTDNVVFLAAAERTGLPSQGTTGLSSSPLGDPHVFVWNSSADIAALDEPTVWLKVHPTDVSGAGAPHTMTAPFLVNNNFEPEIRSIAGLPPGDQEASIPIIFSLTDAEGDSATVGIDFSTDGGSSFAPATIANPDEGTITANEIGGLSTSIAGTIHSFDWVSDSDIIDRQTAVVLRLQPRDNPVPSLGQGLSAQTANFTVDNTVPPRVNTLVNSATSGTITLTYDLFDSEPPTGPTVDLAVIFSAAAGQESPATILNPDEGTVLGNLVQGQTPSDLLPGAPHSFQWDSLSDIGETDVTGVILRVSPTDTKPGAPTEIVIDVANNLAPIAAIQTPGGIPSGGIVVAYSLEDGHGDIASIVPEYSTDGISFFPATERPGLPSEGTANLITGPAPGVNHIFVWDSITDVGLLFVPSVTFRITPQDTAAGISVDTAPFDVNNQTLLPVARIEPMARSLDALGRVTIPYLLADGDSDPSNITVQWRQGIGPFTDATDAGVGAGSQGKTSLGTSPGGTSHVFVWDSDVDLPLSPPPQGQADLEVQIVPTDADGPGFGDASNRFIRGNDAPTVGITAPPAASTQGGLIELVFTLTDSTSDPVDLVGPAPRFSTDNGATWTAAAIAVGGTMSLGATPGGAVHNFAWNSVADLGIADFAGVVFEITPADSIATGNPDQVQFDVSNNDLPILFVGSPSAGDFRSGDVGVEYILIDGNDDPIMVTVRASVDGGATFFDATLGASDVGVIVPPNVITGVTSSSGGLAHSFDWLATTDFALQDTDQARIEITPADPQNPGLTFTTPDFLINNNREPELVSITPFNIGDQSGDVGVDYLLVDSESDLTTVAVSLSTDGGATFGPATVKKCNAADPGSIVGNEIIDLPNSPAGAPHCIIWDSMADIPGLRETAVVLRLEPRDNANLSLGQGFGGQTPAFTTDNTSAPSATIALIPDPSGDDVVIDYNLIDLESSTQEIEVQFSTDNFLTDIQTATECTAACTPGFPFSEGTSGLTSSPVGGTQHFFRWASATDLGRTDVAGVSVRVTPTDTKVGAAGVSNTFLVANNDAPEVIIFDISGVRSGNVGVTYSLRDSFSDTLGITVEYRVGGGAFTPATEGADPNSEGTNGLSSGPLGQEAAHLFSWDSFTDLTTTFFTDAEIRITAADPFMTGAPTVSNAFTVDNSLRADLVLGKNTLFEGAVDARGTETILGPAMHFDGSTLFLADDQNNRVLILNGIPTSNFQTADLVLGQPNFSVNAVNNGGRSASSINTPSAVHSDGTNLYVVERFNYRVLIWNSIPTANMAPADHVLGQADFAGGFPNRGGTIGDSGFSQPYGIAVDSNQLFVSEITNNRILVWDLPIDFGSEGPPADWVLGQPDFTSGDPDRGGSAADNSLHVPFGLFSDGTTLFCADRSNHRVLQWNLPIAVMDQSAVRVIGQPNMITETPGLTAGKMNRPSDVSADSTRTFVADTWNDRVMIWTSAAPATGASANFFLGQPDGITGIENNGGISATSLAKPSAVYSTGSILLIGDAENDRLKIHDPVPAANNAAAQKVWGQRDLSGGAANHVEVTASTFLSPTSVETDGKLMFIVDRENHRVMGWTGIPNVNNKNADMLFGKSDFTDNTETSAATATTLYRPADAAYDWVSDRLIVADQQNHRLVVYDGPFGLGQAGAAYLGQPNATTKSSGTLANRLANPGGVSFDGTYLWACELDNNRVLRFTPPLVTDMAADLVLGQADFNSGSPNHGGGDPEGDQSLSRPYSLVSTGSELLVAELNNQRIIIWNTLPTLDDTPATVVIGQSSFSVPGFSQAGQLGFQSPVGVESDGVGVFVSDSLSNRVMIWNSIPGPGNHGVLADRVLGQPTYFDYTVNWEGVSGRSMFLFSTAILGRTAVPALVTSGGTTHLWTPDRRNNRVLRFDVTP